MPAPSIGQIVIAPVNPDNNDGDNEAPAIITSVDDDGRRTFVNVRVLGNNADAPEWRTGLPLYASRQAMLDDIDEWDTYPDPPHAAYWPPPRVCLQEGPYG